MHVLLRRLLRPKQPLLPLSQMRVFHHACATPFSTLQLCCDLLTREPSSINSGLIEQLQVATNRLIVLHAEITQPISQTQTFCIKDAVAELLPLFYRQDVSLSVVNTAPPTATIFGPRVLFQEMLVCLINNAIDAYAATAQKVVVLAITLHEATVHISICDFGKGIKRFTSVEQRRSAHRQVGRGIGLPFVKDTVSAYFAGSCTYFSQAGMGTRMVLQLPIQGKMNSQNP